MKDKWTIVLPETNPKSNLTTYALVGHVHGFPGVGKYYSIPEFYTKRDAEIYRKGNRRNLPKGAISVRMEITLLV